MAARPNAPRRPHQLTCPQIVSRDRGSVVIEINIHPDECGFQPVLTVAAEVGLAASLQLLILQPCDLRILTIFGRFDLIRL